MIVSSTKNTRLNLSFASVFYFFCFFIIHLAQSLSNMLKKSASGRKFCGSALTPTVKSGLIRLVARIAQSVEQGIENPRVLGSIPSPGTTLLSTDVNRRLFLFVKPAKINTLPKFQLH